MEKKKIQYMALALLALLVYTEQSSFDRTSVQLVFSTSTSGFRDKIISAVVKAFNYLMPRKNCLKFC